MPTNDAAHIPDERVLSLQARVQDVKKQLEVLAMYEKSLKFFTDIHTTTLSNEWFRVTVKSDSVALRNNDDQMLLHPPACPEIDNMWKDARRRIHDRLRGYLAEEMQQCMNRVRSARDLTLATVTNEPITAQPDERQPRKVRIKDDIDTHGCV